MSRNVQEQGPRYPGRTSFTSPRETPGLREAKEAVNKTVASLGHRLLKETKKLGLKGPIFVDLKKAVHYSKKHI